MQNLSASLWNDFKQSFRTNISLADSKILDKLKTTNQRKYFFKTDLLPRIADDLGLLYDETKEFLRVDYSFFKKGSLHKWNVPMIFIESENSWESSYEEALKLCSLNAPLKILILYGLTDEVRHELEGGETNWDYIFRDYVKEIGLVGHFALLVYLKQDNTSVTFKKVVYNENGDTIESGDIIIRIGSADNMELAKAGPTTMN